MNTRAITLDLPLPPSLNKIWRRGKHSTYINPKYKAWKDSATLAWLQQRRGQDWRPIESLFAVTLILCRKKLRKNADIDNRYKCIGDWAQSAGIVSNDKNCVRLLIEFGEAPLGCRVCFCSVD